jgi:hypothetical protein
MYPELNNNCGCPDPTVPAVEIPAPPVCEGEPCPEVINTTCVRYDGPAIECITTTVNMTLNALIIAITDKLCALEAGGSTGEGAVTGITWGCVVEPETTSVSDAVQMLVNAINNTIIRYNVNDFTVVDDDDCSARTLTIKKGVWTQIANNDILWYNGFSAATPIYYLLDADGVIHLKGTLSKSTVMVMSSATYSSGVGIKIAELPGYLLPVAERNTNTPSAINDFPILTVPGFNNTCIYSTAGPVNPNYALQWTLSCSKTVSGSNYYFAINAYVPYGATVNGGGNVNGATNVSMYLHPVKYTSL